MFRKDQGCESEIEQLKRLWRASSGCQGRVGGKKERSQICHETLTELSEEWDDQQKLYKINKLSDAREKAKQASEKMQSQKLESAKWKSAFEKLEMHEKGQQLVESVEKFKQAQKP